MATQTVIPTRMELTRLKKKLNTAVKGHRLLKDKRDELMREFLELVKVNMELREKVEKGIDAANKNFVLAKAGMSEQTLRTALMAPKQEVSLVQDKKNVMSVDIPVFDFKTRTPDENDIDSYGFAFTSGDLDGAVDSLAAVFPDMLKLAEVEKGIDAANKNFVLAKAGMSEQTLRTAMMAPKQEVSLVQDKKNVMSVDIPVFDFKTRTPDKNDIYSYGFAFTSGDLDMAVTSLSDVFPDMLKLAEVEKSCQLMAAEIEKTRRRVNALEHVIIPETQESIKYITMKLDENERSTQVRLMKVKSMMLEEAHHYKEKG